MAGMMSDNNKASCRSFLKRGVGLGNSFLIMVIFLLLLIQFVGGKGTEIFRYVSEHFLPILSAFSYKVPFPVFRLQRYIKNRKRPKKNLFFLCLFCYDVYLIVCGLYHLRVWRTRGKNFPDVNRPKFGLVNHKDNFFSKSVNDSRKNVN